MSKISVILGYKDRDVVRVKRCLDSFKNQVYKDFEVVFIDYGSGISYQNLAKTLVKQYNFCKYIYNNTQGMPWNRSHALNTGVKLSKGEYLLFGDIDIIYSENFLEELIKNNEENAHTYNTMYLLPENFTEWGFLKQKPNNFTDTGISAKGPAHFIKKEYIEKIGGYDEFYCFWGVEDRDLHNRLEILGLKTKWSDKTRTPMYHQWHPMVSNTHKGFFPEKWWDDMNIYYALNINSTERNNDEWGKLYTEENRPLLRNDLTEKEIKFQSEGDSYVKARCIVEVINSLNNLEKNEYLKLIIEKKLNVYDPKLIKFKKLVNKFAKKLFKTEKDLLDFEQTERNSIFSPEEDIMYLVWVLIKRHKIVNDYFIKYNEKETIIKLVRKDA